MSRDELIVLVREQVERIVAHDGQITALATRIAGLVEANEDLACRLARWPGWSICCRVTRAAGTIAAALGIAVAVDDALTAEGADDIG